mmetsp:Transcript_16488/g.45998  ORF Transcript_16488/g.45998 Transcript_16488/m.45998 type:complete len:159 (+) Transcript_16488:186-662(+)
MSARLPTHRTQDKQSAISMHHSHPEAGRSPYLSIYLSLCVSAFSWALLWPWELGGLVEGGNIPADAVSATSKGGLQDGWRNSRLQQKAPAFLLLRRGPYHFLYRGLGAAAALRGSPVPTCLPASTVTSMSFHQAAGMLGLLRSCLSPCSEELGDAVGC